MCGKFLGVWCIVRMNISVFLSYGWHNLITCKSIFHANERTKKNTNKQITNETLMCVADATAKSAKQPNERSIDHRLACEYDGMTVTRIHLLFERKRETVNDKTNMFDASSKHSSAEGVSLCFPYFRFVEVLFSSCRFLQCVSVSLFRFCALCVHKCGKFAWQKSNFQNEVYFDFLPIFVWSKYSSVTTFHPGGNNYSLMHSSFSTPFPLKYALHMHTAQFTRSFSYYSYKIAIHMKMFVHIFH